MNTGIEQALIEQNPHWAGNTYLHAFKRLHDKSAIEDIALSEIQIITGMRRSGKSTLMRTLINYLIKTENCLILPPVKLAA